MSYGLVEDAEKGLRNSPELGTDLVAALSSLDVDDFTAQTWVVSASLEG